MSLGAQSHCHCPKGALVQEPTNAPWSWCGHTKEFGSEGRWLRLWGLMVHPHLQPAGTQGWGLMLWEGGTHRGALLTPAGIRASKESWSQAQAGSNPTGSCWLPMEPQPSPALGCFTAGHTCSKTAEFLLGKGGDLYPGS